MLGTQLGSYRVLSKLGEGGMGAVYVAEHALLKRKVAVKVLLKELTSDASIKRRFMNEARATSQIVHPGIVRIWDFGEHTDGTTYILMELLEGETLRERIAKGGRLALDHALALIKQIAEALGAAHAQRVVHRDLKPENIFLVADPAAPFGMQPKILDFGIAKILDPSVDSPQTRAGSIIGTPLYMSPEQCLAQPGVDHRADLYSLGGIFFLLLCGRPPFDKGNFGDLLAAHLHQAPPRPSTFVPTLPPWIDELTLRLLAKVREERFQSTEEFLDALQAGRESRRVSSEAQTVISTAAATAAQLAALAPPGAAIGSAPTPRGGPLMTPTPPPLTTPPPSDATKVDPATPPPSGATTPPPSDGGDDVSRTRAHSAEELAIPQPHKSRASIPVLLTAAFAGTIALGLGGFYLFARAHRANDEGPAAAHFFIESDPSGADVYRDGKSLCVTPCSLDEKPHAGDARWTVAKRGYTEVELALPADHGGHARVTLHPDKSQ
ncbi:MAG TPA: serine/threonine-protein kinase [Polyangia bacterium]|nr:serine/threonine-protein kinase [Polyangia bacterium]